MLWNIWSHPWKWEGTYQAESFEVMAQLLREWDWPGADNADHYTVLHNFRLTKEEYSRATKKED